MCMNIGLIIRDIKLYQLGIIELDGVPRKVYEFLNEYLTELNEYKSKMYTHYRFFGKDNMDIVINFDEISYDKTLYIRFDILIKLEDEIDLYNYDIAQIIKWWCSMELKIKFNHITNTYVNHKC